jgi:hypothetical protein
MTPKGSLTAQTSIKVSQIAMPSARGRPHSLAYVNAQTAKRWRETEPSFRGGVENARKLLQQTRSQL